MKKIFSMAILALISLSGAFAQTGGEKPLTVLELEYILPKRGMEDKFEAAVKAHDTKFHPDGPYQAVLRKIEDGDRAGWYIWAFGPTTYASIDTRPAKEGGHADDWTKNIDPLVDAYGETVLWNINEDLSFGIDIIPKSKYSEVWNVTLKPGQYYRFKAIAGNLKKVYESMGNTAFIILDNALHTSKSGDVAIVWSFNSFDEWSKDSGVTKAYEKMYGEGSWQHMLDEWHDIVVNYNADIRSTVR